MILVSTYTEKLQDCNNLNPDTTGKVYADVSTKQPSSPWLHQIVAMA